MKDAVISKNFRVKYKLVDKNPPVFCVNSFDAVGWDDPFPNENNPYAVTDDLITPTKPDDWIYPEFR